MKFIIKTLIAALSISFLTFLLPGVHVEGNFIYIIGIALLLSVLNTILKPILVFLTLPATIISLGLFLLIINAIIIVVADKFLSGFTVDNFGWALIFSILLSIINSVAHKIFIQNKSSMVIKDVQRDKVILLDKDGNRL